MFEPSFGPSHVGQHREQPLWAQYQEPDQEHEQDFGAKPTTHSLIGTCSLARLWGYTSQRLRNRVVRFVMPESQVSLCDHQLKPKRPDSSSSLVGASDTALRLAVTNLSLISATEARDPIRKPRADEKSAQATPGTHCAVVDSSRSRLICNAATESGKLYLKKYLQSCGNNFAPRQLFSM